MFPDPAFLDVPGARLAYRTWGSGRQPLLLIHGITSSSLSWARVGPAFADRYRVIAPDLKGHGDSAKPAAGYRIQDQASEVDALCAGLELEQVMVIGHSWGGAIAAQLAAGNPRVTRIILEDPALFVSDEARRQYAENYAAQVGLSRAEAEARFRGANARWTTADEEGKIDAATKGSPDAVRAVFRENAPWDARPALKDIRAPALMVNAPNDLGGIVQPETAQRAQDVGIDVVTVPGADHNVHRTELDAFMRIVTAFLAGEPPRHSTL